MYLPELLIVLSTDELLHKYLIDFDWASSLLLSNYSHPIHHSKFVLSPACSTVASWMIPHIDLMVGSWSGSSLFRSLLPVGWHVRAHSPVLMYIPLYTNFIIELCMCSDSLGYWCSPRGTPPPTHTHTVDSALSTSHPILPSCAVWPQFSLSSSASEFLEGNNVPRQKDCMPYVPLWMGVVKEI